MKRDDEIIKTVFKIGIGLNIVSYIYIGIHYLSWKHFPFLMSDREGLVVSIGIITSGYLILLYSNVFTNFTKKLFGLILIWPLSASILIGFKLNNNNIILLLAFLLGGSSILLSIFKMRNLQGIPDENIFVILTSKKSIFELKTVLKSIILWFLIGIGLLFVCLRWLK